MKLSLSFEAGFIQKLPDKVSEPQKKCSRKLGAFFIPDKRD
jgi:hypothetical protein